MEQKVNTSSWWLSLCPNFWWMITMSTRENADAVMPKFIICQKYAGFRVCDNLKPTPTLPTCTMHQLQPILKVEENVEQYGSIKFSQRLLLLLTPHST